MIPVQMLTLFIAQARVAGGSRADLSTIMVWVALLLVAVIVGGVGLFWVRRRLLGGEETEAAEGVSLQSLREMRSRGELSDAEFEAAKAVVLAQMGAAGPAGGSAAAATANPIAPGMLRARPGFDLTGDPLPKASEPPSG